MSEIGFVIGLIPKPVLFPLQLPFVRSIYIWQKEWRLGKVWNSHQRKLNRKLTNWSCKILHDQSLYFHFLVKYCFKKICMWTSVNMGWRKNIAGRSTPRKAQSTSTGLVWWETKCLALAGPIGLQGSCCRVSSNPMKSSQRQRFWDSYTNVQALECLMGILLWHLNPSAGGTGLQAWLWGLSFWITKDLLAVWQTLLIFYFLFRYPLLSPSLEILLMQAFPPLRLLHSQIATADGELKILGGKNCPGQVKAGNLIALLEVPLGPSQTQPQVLLNFSRCTACAPGGQGCWCFAPFHLQCLQQGACLLLHFNADSLGLRASVSHRTSPKAYLMFIISLNNTFLFCPWRPSVAIVPDHSEDIKGPV